MTLAWAGSYWHEAAFDDPKRLARIIEAGGPDIAYADDRTPWPRTDETRTFRRLNAIKHALRHSGDRAFVKRAALQSELQSTHDLVGKRYFGVVCSEYYRAAGRSNDRPEIVSTAGLALTLAIARFNYGLGVRFSTFVTSTIRRATRGAHRPHPRLAYRERMGDVEQRPAGEPAPPAEVAHLLARLTPAERAVVEMRAGLKRDPVGLRTIAGALDISHMQAQRLWRRALAKMRGGDLFDQNYSPSGDVA
jgi:DNA-directed RNA polymerase specialized sigma24 family protein